MFAKAGLCIALSGLCALSCAVDDRMLRLRRIDEAGTPLTADADAAHADTNAVHDDAGCSTNACVTTCGNTQNSPDHCGRCNYRCTGVCENGSCKLLSSLAEPGPIAVNGTDIYWLSPLSSMGNVNRTTLNGEGFEVLASNQGSLHAIAVDAHHVYWAGLTVGLMQLSLSGGEPVQLAPVELPRDIAQDENNVYVLNDPSSLSTDGSVIKVSKAGGVTTIASPVDLGRSIAVDATHVYWTDFTAYTVTRAPVGGGMPEVVGTPQHSAIDVTVDAAHVVWNWYDIGDGVGKIVSLAKQGGAAQDVVDANAGALVVDGDHVYWIDRSMVNGTRGTGRIRRVRLSGGEQPTDLFTGDAPQGIFVDATSVYWTTMPNNDGKYGSLWKCAK